MLLSGGYPESWDDDEKFEEHICEECKSKSSHKLDFTFDTKAGYQAHIKRKHPERFDAPAKRTKKDIRAAGKAASIQAAIDAAAKKRNQDSDFTEVLTQSIERAEVKKAEIGNQEDIEMAAKKKVAKKKSAAPKKEKRVSTAEAIGRERKLLLRLSNDEYEALQAKATKQGVSMAMLLRSVI